MGVGSFEQRRSVDTNLVVERTRFLAKPFDQFLQLLLEDVVIVLSPGITRNPASVAACNVGRIGGIGVIHQAHAYHRLGAGQKRPGIGPHLTAAALQILHLRGKTLFKPFWIEKRLHGGPCRGHASQFESQLVREGFDFLGSHGCLIAVRRRLMRTSRGRRGERGRWRMRRVVAANPSLTVGAPGRPPKFLPRLGRISA